METSFNIEDEQLGFISTEQCIIKIQTYFRRFLVLKRLSVIKLMIEKNYNSPNLLKRKSVGSLYITNKGILKIELFNDSKVCYLFKLEFKTIIQNKQKPTKILGKINNDDNNFLVKQWNDGSVAKGIFSENKLNDFGIVECCNNKYIGINNLIKDILKTIALLDMVSLLLLKKLNMKDYGMKIVQCI